MPWIKIIGLLAAAATTVAFLPQTIKSWKTKLLISDLLLIAANVITLSLTMSTLILKIRYK